MGYNPLATGTPQQARSTSVLQTNNTGLIIAKATPVRTTATGIATINPAIESQVDAIMGLTNVALNDGESGEVISSGRLLNIATSAPIGAPLYLSKTGILTETKPAIGVGSFVAGDFIVRIGVVAQNSESPSQKDLLINIQIMGQL